MEDRLDKLDRRLDRIEQILPTLATKDDLRGYATRDDLRAYPTKDDLRNELKAFATKEDLKAYPTKDDLRNELKAFATKKDLAELADRFLGALAQAFEEAQRHTRELHEDLVERIKVSGEHRPRRHS